tara:strand:- start:211879 stop:213174 length:1296 start_codon:yes stop_codon:yes gene_type:complete
VYSAHHFYLTFNPHLNDYIEPDYTQAHEFYEYLREAVKKDKKAYAYWGKFIAKDRDHKVDHEKFKKVIEQNSENGVSTHLYISDFKNVWVGKVESVHKTIGKDFKTLNIYKDKNVEIWFKLSDFTLLEYTYESTANKLSELYIDNEYMDLKIHEVSPFTTAVRYPAILQDLADEHYFDELDTTECSHLILQENQAINNTGLSKVIKTIHNYAFPESMYNKIPHSAKHEIESAEIDMSENRHHNLKKVAFSYIKALEIVLNDLVFHHLKKQGAADEFFVNPHVMPPKILLDDFDSEAIPLSQFHKNFSINQIIYFVQKASKSNRLNFARAFGKHKQFLRWVTSDLQKTLEDNKILELRGILAHSDSDKISDEDALAIRNIILGVGCTGLISQAYQCFYPEDFRPIAHVMGAVKDKTKEAINQNKKTKLKLVS